MWADRCAPRGSHTRARPPLVQRCATSGGSPADARRADPRRSDDEGVSRRRRKRRRRRRRARRRRGGYRPRASAPLEAAAVRGGGGGPVTKLPSSSVGLGNVPQLDAIAATGPPHATSRAWTRATQGRRGGNDAAGDGGGGTNAAESGPEEAGPRARGPPRALTLVQGPPGTGKTHTVGALRPYTSQLFARYQSALHRAIVEHADRGREAEEDGTFFPEDVSANDAADETARWASGFDALHAEDNRGDGPAVTDAARR